MKKAGFLLLNVIVFLFFSVTRMYGLLGDPNNDGSIDIVDALLTAQYYVGLNPSNFDANEADVNSDNTIDIIDALLIAQYYVGLINEFPGGTTEPSSLPTSPPTPPPPGFTPFPDVTPKPEPTSLAPFSVERTGALPLEMGNRDNWRNSVLSGNYLYMTSEVSFKVFDVSQLGNPVFSGFCEIPGDNPEHIIVISNNYAYVSCSFDLVVLDISNPSSPSVIGSITMPPVYSMIKNGNYLYIGCIDEVFVVDITQPDNPVVIDGVGLFRAGGIAIYGSYAYMVNVSDDMLVVFDVSDQGNPVQVDTISINTRIDTIVLSGHYAFLLGNDLIEVYDTSNPASPVFMSSFTTVIEPGSQNIIYGNTLYSTANGYVSVIDITNPGQLALVTTLAFENANSLSIQGSTGYLVCGTKDEYDNDVLQQLCVLDLSNPASPILITSIAGTRDVSSIKISGNYAYITDRAGSLKSINISDPAHPVLSGSLSLVNPYNLQIKGNYIYIADGTGGFKVVDISNPGTPVLKASLPTHDIAVDVYIDGNNAYVAEQVSGITVIDISNPLSPVETDSTAGQPRPSPFPTETPIPPTEPTSTPYPTSTPAVTPDINIWGAMNLVVKDTNIVLGNNISPEIKIVTAGSLEVVNLLDTYLDVDYDAVMNGFDLEGNYLYFAQKNNLFRIIDVTDSLNPLMADGLVLGSNVKGNGLVVNYPYVFTSSGAIDIIDVSNPADVLEAGCISIPGKAGGIAFEGGYIFIPSRHTNYELIIIRTGLQ